LRKIAGGRPVVIVIDAAAQPTQGCSGSRPVP
jgi:hypothetical protein